MTIRTDADIRKLREQRELTAAEETLIANCRAGEPTKLGEDVPDDSSDARTIRADLLRYLITGGCAECPTQDKGVGLQGAYVSGTLDLKFATARGLTGLIACRFECPIEALQARFAFLDLSGSYLPGLNAVTTKVAGSVRLKHTEIKGEVCLAGAQIRGSLDCDGARFLNTGGSALTAFYAQVAQDVRLNNVEVKGEANVQGARVDGQLQCENASFSNVCGNALNAEDVIVGGSVFLTSIKAKEKVGIKAEGKVRFKAEGNVSFFGAQIGGQMSCSGAKFVNPNGRAFLAQDMTAKEFIWKKVKSVRGQVDLSGAKVDCLTDDRASWNLVEDLVLYGFQYERIHQYISVNFRLEWLLSGAVYEGEFRPQPYEQLAKVFRMMGHTGDAQRVGLQKEILLAADWKRRAVAEQAKLRARRDETPRPSDHREIQNRLARLWLDLRVLPAWHGALRYLVGYGHAPQRVLAWTAGTILVMGLFYLYVWNFGGMVPNSDIVLTSPHWADAMSEQPDFPSLAWIMSETGQHYETFNAFAYAGDVFIPLVDLGQEAAWTETTATVLGRIGWLTSWFLKLFGWIVTAVGAAAITGIIRRE